MRIDARPIGATAAALLLLTSGCAAALNRRGTEGGLVTIGVTSSGSGIAALTFRVTIEPAGLGGTIKADAGVLTRSGVPPGDHVVRLLDVPARCRVDGGPERTIRVAAEPALPASPDRN